MSRRITRALIALLTLAACGLPARAATVVFDPPALALTKDDTTPKTVGVYVKGLTDGKSLAFASFLTLWNRAALNVGVASWDTTALDVPGVVTTTTTGANYSAARVKATGAVKPGVALLTLRLTPKPGKVGNFSLKFRPSANLNVLHGPTGLAIPVSSWATLPVTISDGASSGAALASSLAVSSPGARAATIMYSLTSDAAVSVEIRNVAGRLVRTVVSAHPETAGMQSHVWPMVNDQGAVVPPGAYLAVVTVSAADGRQQRLMQAFTVAR
ncbi:MAG: hypothetical protein FJ313_01570 [Gemmatimonadetes bacterium]|nr:hypothetical protein [Gemmatimonadota bacterium]